MKNYLKIFFILFFACILILSIPIFYLYSIGEYMSVKDIVEKQNQSSGKMIYGTALFKNTHAYKKLLLTATLPNITTLGSSRVMQFRQHMFLERFINLGGAMNSINGGMSLIPDLLNSRPEIVLIGIDAWWFNDKYKSPDVKFSEPESLSPKPSFHHSLMVFEWLHDGKLTFKIFLRTIAYGTDDIGVAGNEKDGFGPDGSYYYTRRIQGRKHFDDNLFKDTFERIEKGKRRFEYSSVANNRYIKDFVKFISALEKNNIKVIIFFPPFAKAVNNRLFDMEEKYKYIDDIKDKFHKNNINFYDYTDASIVGSSDCEFLDGFHGGEVTYMRILSDLARKVPSLNDFVDQNMLRESISKYKGKAFIPDEKISSHIEIDFLGLGCSK